MEIITHPKNDLQIVELVSDDILIQTAEDGSQLIADLYYQGFDLIIIHSHQLNQDFFDLKTGLAGEILQKVSNWRIRIAIVGDFTGITSKAMRDFIFESNKGKLVNFVETVNELID